MATTFFFLQSSRTSSMILRLFVLLSAVNVSLSYKPQYYRPQQVQNRYPASTNDNINVESLLNNSRVVNAYLKCLLGTGACTKEGREMKRALPDLLRSACSKCSSVDKERLRVFLRRVHGDPKLYDAWQKVLDQYDPQRLYAPSLDKFIANRPTTVAKPQTSYGNI